MKKEWQAAYTEYFLVAFVRGERATYYNGQVYRTKKLAERDAARMNAHRDLSKRGPVTVESCERPAGWTYVTTLRL